MQFRSNLLVGAAFVAAVTAFTPVAAQSQTEAAEEAAEDIVVTGRFVDAGASSATKLDAPVRDIPLAITSYSGKLLQTLEASNVSDIYRYMTGVQRSGNTGTDITLRGFRNGNNDRNSIMIDGLPGLTTTSSPSTASTDHIEIVRGPASVLYGQAQPGGFVNIIAKKPQRNASHEFELRFDKGVGSLDRAVGALFTADSTGPITSDGNLTYRLIGEIGVSNGFRDFSNDRPVLIAPSLSWSNDGTSITVLAEYRNSRRQFDSFLVAPGRTIANIAAPTTSYHERGDFTQDEGTSLTLLAKQRLSDAISINGSVRSVRSTSFSQLFEPVTFNGTTTVNRRARRQDNRRSFVFGDLNLAARFEIAGIEFRSVFGLNLGHEASDFNRLQFFNGPATGADSMTVSVADPVHGLVRDISTYPLVNPATADNLNRRYGSIVASGAYASTLIKFSDQFKGMAGIRYAREELSVIDLKLANFTPAEATNDAVLPMGGLIYQPTRAISFFANYSTSFAPVAATTQDTNGRYTFKPTTASSIEGGVKLDLWGGKLNVTASYFDITKKNTVNLFPCVGGQCGQQVGEERSNGFELEINARPSDNLTLIAGVTALDPRVVKSLVTQQEGATLANSAKFNAQGYARYDLTEGPLAGVGFGLGVSHTGVRQGLLPTATLATTLTLPAYTLVDGAIYLRDVGPFSASLKASNLLDERYYESAGFSGELQVLPGAPRTLSLVLRTQF